MSERLNQGIFTVVEILGVIIAVALQATRSRDETRRLRAETVQRECGNFLQFLQEQDFEHFEDPWEDFWAETLDNHEACNRYLQDLKRSDVSDEGTISAEFDVWLKISREHANLIQWLPRLKEDLKYEKQSWSRRRPPSSYRGNVMSEAGRPRARVRHSFSDGSVLSEVNTPHSRFQRPAHSQARSITYPQLDYDGSLRNSTSYAPAKTFSTVDELSQGLENIQVIDEDPFDDVGATFPPSAGDRHSPDDYFHNTSNFSATSMPHHAGHPPQHPRRQSTESVYSHSNILPIYNFPNLNSGSHIPQHPVHPVPRSNTSPVYTLRNHSQQSLNMHPIHDSPPDPAPYYPQGPTSPPYLRRTSSRQSIDPASHFSSVPIVSDPDLQAKMKRRVSFTSSAINSKPVKGILKNGSSRSGTTDFRSRPPEPSVMREASKESWSTTATAGGTKKSWSTTATAGGGTDWQSEPLLQSPGASSSSTVPFLDLEHEPRSRYPPATHTGAIRPPAGPMFTVHHLTQKPIVVMSKLSKHNHEPRHKDEHDKKHGESGVHRVLKKKKGTKEGKK
ncbi:hypothetical protein PM082_017810 [Marasmius tenuissimus]|nr:hypothetical protein PM082_017810 [Marasmius tenuissimus]